MKQDYQLFLWLAAGLALGVILAVSADAVRYVPTAAAFGLLCFGCGIVFVQFLGLRRREEESIERWAKEFDDLSQKQSEIDKAREALEKEKSDWKAEMDALDSHEPEDSDQN